MEENFVYALTLTLIAGLSTGIGSLIAMFAKRTSRNFLSFALGFSAGVMVYISFMDILPKATVALGVSFGDRVAQTYCALAFFGGILLIALIDRLVPSVENPHEVKSMEGFSQGVVQGGTQGRGIEKIKMRENGEPQKKEKLMRMGVMTALAIGIHNFPEGMATFMAALQDPEAGLAIAVAIAIHNIPEGIAVAVPVYYATRSRKRALKWSFLSGLSEPVGAMVGWVILRPFMNDSMFGLVFAAVAGIMVYISFDELLPAAREWGKHHSSIWGMVLGMAVMAAGIIVMA